MGKYKGQLRVVGVCRLCGANFDDYEGKPHRKYICRKCWNNNTKMAMRRQASTLEGYLKQSLNSVKNNARRKKFHNDIDLQFLLDLYKLQNGKCALTGKTMTWGSQDNVREDKQYHPPFNISVCRLDSSKGATKDNVILVCNMVSMFKGQYDMSLLFEVSKKIANNRGSTLEG